MFENIERIKAPSKEVFFAEYVKKRKPVIFTDMFDKEPIHKITGAEDALRILGDVKIEIQDEYTTRFMQKLLPDVMKGIVPDMDGLGAADIASAQSKWSLKKYLDYIADNPTTPKMCAEGLLPTEVAAQYRLPDYCRGAEGKADPDGRNLFFMGNAGNRAHMHYDSDLRQVLQYQLFGEKRVILVPPSEGKKVAQIFNFGTVIPTHFTEADKDAFVRYVNGYQCSVRTGETLYMPPAIWHNFNYSKDSMAVSFRFGRNRYSHFIAEKGHLGFYMQNLGALFDDAARVEETHMDAFREIEAAIVDPSKEGVEKWENVERVAASLCERYCPDIPKGLYQFTAFEELNRRLIGLSVSLGGLYNAA